MSTTPEQISAYMAWLDDRGLRALPPRQAQTKIDHPQLLVLTDLLSDSAKDMVRRIMSALNLGPQSYFLLQSDSLTADQIKIIEQVKFVLALGAAGARHLADCGAQDLKLNEIRTWSAKNSTLLLIPHPDAMLAQPQLKVKAWEALQILKNSLNN